MTGRPSSAREDILRSIRDNLAASSRHERLAHAESRHDGRMLPVASAAAQRVEEPRSLVVRFSERLEAAGGKCVTVASPQQATSAIAAILIEAGVRKAAAPDAALVAQLAPASAGVEWSTIDGMSREQLFQCDAGVTTAQWGIAETGTLVLEAAAEKHRLLSLVPPLHVAVLRADRICDSIGDALSRLNVSANGSAAVTFITGPSRTSDIELTLTIGVHGPGALHVILVESTA